MYSGCTRERSYLETLTDINKSVNKKLTGVLQCYMIRKVKVK